MEQTNWRCVRQKVGKVLTNAVRVNLNCPSADHRQVSGFATL